MTFMLNLPSVVSQHLPLVASPFPHPNSLQDIILPKLRTCACFPVTSETKVATAAVWANSIVALRVYVTDGRRSGTFINIWSKYENFDQMKYEMLNVFLTCRRIK